MFLRNIKGVFIDLDGTLINSLPVYAETYRILFEKLNIKTDENFIKNNGESPEELAKKIYEKYLKNYGITYENFFKMRNEILEKNIDKIKFNLGSKELLFFLKEKNYKIGIVTSSNRDFTEKVLKNLGLENFFDIIITSDDVKNTKPDPEPYILAVKKLNLLAGECLAIEDSIYGVISAKSAGLNVIAVLTGVGNKQEFRNLGIYKIFKNLKEVYKFFEENLVEKEYNKQ
ncbi:MAG: HAD family phosphatase [Candidatus Aenigmatarchaeota archaeon]